MRKVAGATALLLLAVMVGAVYLMIDARAGDKIEITAACT